MVDVYQKRGVSWWWWVLGIAIVVAVVWSIFFQGEGFEDAPGTVAEPVPGEVQAPAGGGTP